MATAGSTNKSAFLRDLLGKNADLNLGQATEAWQEAGNDGEIGSSLYYNVKRELKGGTGSEVESAPKPKSKVAARGPKAKRAAREGGEARTEANEKTSRTAVRGPASDLYLWLWNRRSSDGLEVFGDDAVAKAWTGVHF